MAIMMQEGGEGEGGRGRGGGEGGGGGGNTLEVINIMQGMGSTIIQFLFKINWTNKSDMKEFFFTLKDLKESCCKWENF